MRPADWSPVGLDADPTPGDPVLVLAGGQDYLEVAGSIDDAAGAMSRLDVAGTVSQAVDALMETKEDTVSQIRRAHSRYQATGEALVDYARTLDRVQAETLHALERARQAKDAADSAAGSRDRYQDLADSATDAEQKREFQQQADQAGGNADDANGQAASARSDIESSVSDRDRAASDAVSRIEDITSGDDLNDSWWDDWGSKVVAAIADIADMVSMIAGLLAIVVAFIPVVGTALAGVLIVVAAVAAIVSALANITLAATGERSWAEAGIAIAGAALSVIGLGGAAKAATGLSKAALKQGMKTGAKKAWCKVGFGTCFTAGTLVRTVDGDQPIEHIRAGDKVWAHHLATGHDELQLVMETFVRTTTTLLHLTIGGSVVTTTDEHPFMVANMGWILARDLQPGDILLTPDGTVTLDRIDIEHRDPDDAVTVHNFHVETHHNYYVLAGDLPVLVHNAAGHNEMGHGLGKAAGTARADAKFMPTKDTDVFFENQDEALDAALKSYDVPNPPEMMEARTMYGKNPNLNGPGGEPWEEIHVMTSDGRYEVIDHHANGHFFKDKNWYSLPHYHGAQGEHFFYGSERVW